MESINIVDVLDQIRSTLNKTKEDILRDYTLELNSAFGNTLLEDGSNAGENVSIQLDDYSKKTLRVYEALLNSLGSLEAKINTFNELGIVYGRQSLNGVTNYLLSTFPEDLLSIKFYFGFLNPLGEDPLPAGVTATFNSSTRKFDFIIEKNSLVNDNTFFSVKADNAYTIKPYLKINPDLPEEDEDVNNPIPDSNLDKFYFNFAGALHSVMPIARLYEGDITRSVVEPVNGQEVFYAESIAVPVNLTFKIRFLFDPQEGHNIDTRQEIVDAFNTLVAKNRYGEIGKNINMQDFASLANVAGVAWVNYAWTSSDPTLVANQDFINSNNIIAVPAQVYLNMSLSRDNVEMVTS